MEEPSAVNEPQMGTHRLPALVREERHTELPVRAAGSHWGSGFGLLQLGLSNPGLLERGLILHSGKMSEQVFNKIRLWLFFFLVCQDMSATGA